MSDPVFKAVAVDAQKESSRSDSLVNMNELARVISLQCNEFHKAGYEVASIVTVLAGNGAGANGGGGFSYTQGVIIVARKNTGPA